MTTNLHHDALALGNRTSPALMLALPLLLAAPVFGQSPNAPAGAVAAPSSASIQADAAASSPTGAPSTEAATQSAPADASAASATPAVVGADAPRSPFSIQFNLDYTTAYYFRGILQQDDGLILQPYAKFTLNVFQEGDFKIDTFVSAWNSFGRNSGSNTGDLTRYWYECDLSAGVVFTKDKFSFTTSYIFYTSPSDAFQTVQEVDFSLAFDDSELLGPFALHPYALVAIETGTDYADGADTSRGTYLELGIAPGFSVDAGKVPIAISFPVALGLSLDDYYQSPITGIDDTYGYLQVGGKASIPLPFGDRFGAWTLNAGVYGLFLGDSLTEFNRGDDAEAIGTVGVQVNF